MRKMLVKRLVLFLVLAFGITWGASFLCHLLFPDPEEAGRTGFFSIVGMMGPALGHLLTRLLTREGWQETYLGWGRGSPGTGIFCARNWTRFWTRTAWNGTDCWG